MVAYPEGDRDKPIALGRCAFAVHKVPDVALAEARKQGVVNADGHITANPGAAEKV